jgi:hypothetical protein
MVGAGVVEISNLQGQGQRSWGASGAGGEIMNCLYPLPCRRLPLASSFYKSGYPEDNLVEDIDAKLN